MSERYRKFSDLIKSEVCPYTPAKAAKAAKVAGTGLLVGTELPSSLAGLAGLAGGYPQTRIFSSAIAAAFAALERQCPASIPVDRWQRAVDDGCRFLGQWAEQGLGWTADDLFGLHPTAPLSRYDRMGLVWLLRGKKVVALTAAAATIRTPTGGMLSFYRRAVGAPNTTEATE
jgi:hypothetical protein